MLVLDENERDLLSDLYDKHRHMMAGVAMNILKNHHLTEDAVQQAFVRIIEYLDKLEDVDSQRTKAYLVIVTKNIAIDICKKNRNTDISYDEFDIEIADSKNMEDDLLDQMGHDDVIGKIRALPANYREIMYMKYCENLSIKEIAALLSMNVSLVKKRLERGREKLADSLSVQMPAI